MSSVQNQGHLYEISKGFARAEQADMDQVRRDMAREQQWLIGERKFISNDEINQAFLEGELALVNQSDYYRPIKRLLTESGNAHLYPPYLKPAAAQVLDWVTGRAHDYLERMEIDSSTIRYPVTSLIRSMERQQELAAQEGKLALPPDESGHSTGWDFDIDSSSYYLYEDGDWKSVSRRDPERQRLIAHAHEGMLGNIVLPTLIAKSGSYDKRVRHALHLAVAEHYAGGVLSPVIEYVNTSNEVIHIGVNPEYFKTT